MSTGVPDYGKALRAGLLAATGTYVVNFDVDLYDLNFVERAIAVMAKPGGPSIVVGSKRSDDARDERHWTRQVVTAVFSGLLRHGFPGPVVPVNPKYDEVLGLPCAPDIGSAGPSGSPVAAGSPTPVPSHGDGTCPTSRPASLKAGDVYEVTIKTKLGNVVMRIDGALAPIATGNFVALVKCHFYDGIVFHRLVPGFVIQGGDPAGTGGGGPGYTITDEGIKYVFPLGRKLYRLSSQVVSVDLPRLMVLEANGNPIEVSAVCLYQVREAHKAVLEVEKGLAKGTPQPFRLGAHHWLILHGRYICKARTPECWRCRVADLCRFKPKTAAPKVKRAA